MGKLIVIFISIFIFGCQNLQNNESSSSGVYNPAEALEYDEDIEIESPRTVESSPQPESDFSLEKGSKIIKVGNITFEVNNLDVAKRIIDSLVKTVDGYYENESYKSYGNRITNVFKIRIPNVRFDNLIEALDNGVGKLKSKNISANDVTEEYVDINIRLINNLAYLKQYQTILLKAKSIKEILEVQEKIRNIEEEIDSKKGRLKYLDDNVKYSTLNLEISELATTDLGKNPNFGRRVLNAFNNGGQGFLSFIVLIVNLWPFVLLFVIFYFGRKSLWSKIKRLRSTPEKD